MDALSKTLREHYPQLSVGQRRVADFLSEHPDEAQFLTARQLAERCGFSESGIVRFAQQLGFSGYPELRRAVRGTFRMSATHRAMLTSGTRALAREADLVEGIARRDAQLIGETAARLDRAALARCAAALLAAPEVYVVGHRASYSLAEYFAGALRQGIGVGLPLAFGSGMAYDIIGSARAGSVMVAVSITPYSRQTLDLLEAAQAHGLRRIVVTDHPLGAAARRADEVVLFETEIHAFTSSYVGVLTIFHILLALISRDSGERTAALLRAVGPQLEAFEVRHGDGVPEDGAAGTCGGTTRPEGDLRVSGRARGE